MTSEFWAAARSKLEKRGDVEWSPTTMTKRMIGGGLLGAGLGGALGARSADPEHRGSGAVLGATAGGVLGLGAGRLLHALRPVVPGEMAGFSQSLANNSAGSLFSVGDAVYRTTGREPKWSEDPASPYRKWHNRWVTPYSDHARNNPAAPTYTSPDGRVRVFRNRDRLLAQIDADQRDSAGRIGGAAVHAVRNVTGPRSSEAFAQEALEYVRKNYSPHGLTFGKEAVSLPAIGMGLGAVAGAMTAPKDEEGRPQGRLQRALVGGALGAGAGHLLGGGAAGGVSRAFHASPLGTAYRAGPGAGLAHVGRSLGSMGSSLREGAAVWGRDLHGVRANPTGAVRETARQATRPYQELAAHPLQTLRAGAENMGPVGQALFATTSVPGAIADWRSTEDADGRDRGPTERALSAAGRIGMPLAFAAHAPTGNKLTALAGGVIGQHLAAPVLSGAGRTVDRVTGLRRAQNSAQPT